MWAPVRPVELRFQPLKLSIGSTNLRALQHDARVIQQLISSRLLP